MIGYSLLTVLLQIKVSKLLFVFGRDNEMLNLTRIAKAYRLSIDDLMELLEVLALLG